MPCKGAQKKGSLCSGIVPLERGWVFHSRTTVKLGRHILTIDLRRNIGIFLFGGWMITSCGENQSTTVKSFSRRVWGGVGGEADSQTRKAERQGVWRDLRALLALACRVILSGRPFPVSIKFIQRSNPRPAKRFTRKHAYLMF